MFFSPHSLPCVCLDHAEEIRATVKRAEKDFQLETTLKTYEEIWLSKTFQLTPYQSKQVDQLTHSSSLLIPLL